jgi:hypothetical protein
MVPVNRARGDILANLQTSHPCWHCKDAAPEIRNQSRLVHPPSRGKIEPIGSRLTGMKFEKPQPSSAEGRGTRKFKPA